MSLTPQALRLLSREIVTLRSDPPEGVRIVVDEDDISGLEGWVQGPSGTPYEGGYFRIRFDFGPEYPNLPPKCTMLTKIFHPNMSKTGEICVDTLKKSWKKEYGVGHVLVTIKCLLIYPNPESALDEEAGKQLLADYDGYCKYAKLITNIHATPKLPPAPFRELLPSSSKSSNSHLLTTASSSRPPHSTSSTTSTSSATTTTAPTTRPSPLQTHAQQVQSPAIVQEATMADDVPLKGVKTTGTKLPSTGKPSGTAGNGVSKAKRGLKRL